jgi:3-dehydroquinate dehydratase
MFYNNASGRKIYVPTASVEAYKAASYWSSYASYIVGYDFAKLSLAPTMSDVLNVSYSNTLCTILLKASVEYEVLIPLEAKSWLYYNNKISQNGDYDEIQIRAYENTTNASRSATVTFKQIDGNLSTSVTINQAYFEGVDGIVMNPGAYTHTSIALLDAVKAVSIPTIEIHISDVNSREDFRKISYIRSACIDTVSGLGVDGYLHAIDKLIKYIQEENK